MPTLPLVILDCDGVLVDSEPITNALLAEAATEAGWPLSPSDSIALFKGRDLRVVQRLIEERLRRSLGDAFISDYRERMARAFADRGVPPVEGAPELLDWLDHRAIPHAVASNGPHEKMRLTLGRIRLAAGADDQSEPAPDWYRRFEGRRFSAYDIARWKPDPGLFLHAAASMGAPHEACIVVEDSPAGIAAARAAHMRAIALAGLTPAAELRDAGATEVCASIAEVHDLLREWIP